jgi:hypothetical protein
MVTVGLLVRLSAKPGKEAEVAGFLEGGSSLVEEEPATVAWFAVRLGPRSSASSTPSPTRRAGRRTWRAAWPRR